MRITARVQPRAFTRENFAVVRLVGDGATGELAQLDVEYSKLVPLRTSNPLALDFLLCAASVYAIDKLILRACAADSWTRDIALTLPVSDVDRWTSASRHLVEALSFLTGDRWEVEFVPLSSPLTRNRARRRQRRPVPRPQGDIACLFSGGLDSLVGVIDQLEENRDQRLLLVGHHDGQMAGPLADQQRILNPLRQQYPRRFDAILARVGHTSKGPEITLRGRSLLFIALGVYAASSVGPGTPLLIPENGTIALNAPLTPSRRGSCSTRTAHPHYLATVQRVLADVGLDHSFINPLELRTKGETVSLCRNLDVLRTLAPLSVSCAKRGHKRSWRNRSVPACGRCMPCVYRRAALHTIGSDTEAYGNDICTGDVDIDARDEEGPNDLRACFSFLKRKPSADEIALSLLANGKLDIGRLPDYADLVRRAMEEIRRLLRDKGTREIQRRAGLLPRGPRA